MRAAFLFGKLPVHGDFVARGLGSGDRDALDAWFSTGLAVARDALGEGFEPAYDQAPPWRFASHGAGGWRAGAMTPSVDLVGRRYPILVGIDGLDGAEVAGAGQAIEGLIYDALGGGWDADRLVAAAAAVAPARDSVWTGGDRWWTMGGGTGTGAAFDAASLAGARPPGLMRAMLTMNGQCQDRGHEQGWKGA